MMCDNQVYLCQILIPISRNKRGIDILHLINMATSSDLKQFMLGQLFGSTHIPKNTDLSGKTIVVTGANTGLGFECAKHLYVHLAFASFNDSLANCGKIS